MRILAIGDHTETDPVTDREETSSVFLDTATGELQPTSLIASAVVTGEGGILAGCHLYGIVGRLHDLLNGYPGWTIQVQAKERRLVRGSGRVAIGVFLPIYFGFIQPREQRRSAAGGRGKRNYRTHRYHRLFHCLDLAELEGLRTVPVLDCAKHAESILAMCQERGVKFNANKGGLASRLLKASPHWTRDRRAAPEFVNDTAREQLPGNYYGLAAPLRKQHKTAIYVDQISAHHSVAASTPTPHPGYVRARGHYHRLDGAWIHGWQTERLDELFSQIGLVAAVCSVPAIPDKHKHLYPPFMHEPGKRLRYFYTNEREYFDTRGSIDYVVAAWTSTEADPVLPEFASWALDARSRGPGRKAVLLAAYGALAQRIDRPTQVYFPWKGKGMKTNLPGAGPMQEIVRTRKPNQPQPTHLNVLSRGIIEAETRKRSIMYARELEDSGVPVLSIYVDGLILDTDTLPFMPEGWEVEAHLTNVVFRHPNTWRADEMRKEPGIPRDNTPADQARRMMRVPLEPSPEGVAARADRREVESERLLGRARWRELQGVLPV